MQGISAKEHQLIMANFNKYEQMAMIARGKISDEEDTKTREGIAELRKIHTDFQRLLREMHTCVKDYENRRKSLQSVMHRCIREMNSEVEKKERYLK